MTVPSQPRRVVIMGAAGRDFHHFQCCYRDDPSTEVIAFTAAQIPDIAGRRYPASLAGPGYPEGIPIYPEAELGTLIAAHHVDDVVFSYSDVPNQTVMTIAQMVLAAGANFRLLGAHETMLPSRLPVIAVCAVRTGCGKSAVTRRVVDIVRQRDLRPVVIRHPMPYGELAGQRVQRFATFDDLTQQHCTIEEREEYEPHLEQGTVVYAGVDYQAVLAAADGSTRMLRYRRRRTAHACRCPTYSSREKTETAIMRGNEPPRSKRRCIISTRTRNVREANFGESHPARD